MPTRPAHARTAAGIAAAALLAALCGCVGAPAQVGPQVAEGYGYVCAAGFYQCRLPQQVRVGEHCSCPGLGAPSFGYVR